MDSEESRSSSLTNSYNDFPPFHGFGRIALLYVLLATTMIYFPVSWIRIMDCELWIPDYVFGLCIRIMDYGLRFMDYDFIPCFMDSGR